MEWLTVKGFLELDSYRQWATSNRLSAMAPNDGARLARRQRQPVVD
jgi:hypothetical protein